MAESSVYKTLPDLAASVPSRFQPTRRSFASRVWRRLRRYYRHYFQHYNHVYMHQGPYPAEHRDDCAFVCYHQPEEVPDAVREAIIAYGGSRAFEGDRSEMLAGSEFWVAFLGNTVAGTRHVLRAERVRKWFVPLFCNDIVIFRGRTFPAFRGRGISPSMMRYIMHQRLASGGVAYTDVRVYNYSSIRSIEKAGFKRIATMKPISRSSALVGLSADSVGERQERGGACAEGVDEHLNHGGRGGGGSSGLLPRGVASIGVIVIGRNEGELLQMAFESLPDCQEVLKLYVDSGSTDGSVDLAISMGIPVHELDSTRPFSAARARREGVEVLLEVNPDLQFIQFLDGDCTLDSKWIESAITELRSRGDLGVVCGILSEANPNASVYNRLSQLQWRLPPGDIRACGGIFAARVSAYMEAGGFREDLLTGEEEDLCSRIRERGYRILRIASPMAVHDSGLMHFGQWWSRVSWGGYGDALKLDRSHGGYVGKFRSIIRMLLWPVVVPMVLIGGAIGAAWSPPLLVVPALCVAAYIVLLFKIMVYRFRHGDRAPDAIIYAIFCVLSKWPAALGFMRYFLHPTLAGRRPDPHAAGTGAVRLRSRVATRPPKRTSVVGRTE